MDLKDEAAGRGKETRGGEERSRGVRRLEKKEKFLCADGCFMPLLQSVCLETLWSISERAEDKH